MRLHSDTITVNDLFQAAEKARQDGQDIFIADAALVGSRTRAHRIDFHAGAANGRYARNSGHYGGDRYNRAASWSAWGYLIAHLFAQDPNAVIGQYKSRDHFRQLCAAEVHRLAKHHNEHPDSDFLSI